MRHEIEAVEAMINNNSEILNTKNDGNLPIHYAAQLFHNDEMLTCHVKFIEVVFVSYCFLG